MGRPNLSGSDLREGLLAEMERVFGDDRRRIRHTQAVLAWAEKIAAGESADRDVVTAAAILHDIGIHAAERKHGSSSGRWQELEGPPIARPILDRLGIGAELAEQVCGIIAHHHNGRMDTPEFRVVWDADWMVNLPGECPDADAVTLDTLIGRIFRTQTGRTTARDTFLERTNR